MVKVQDTVPIHAPRISQLAALGAMKAGPTWVYERYATLESSRQTIIDAMAGSLPKIMGGTGAMYLMGQLPTTDQTDDTNKGVGGVVGVRDDVEVARQLVELYGVSVIPGSFCGFPGWIRVCYANLKPDVCVIAAERLRTGLHAILKD